jgi:hypothetical protein
VHSLVVFHIDLANRNDRLCLVFSNKMVDSALAFLFKLLPGFEHLQPLQHSVFFHSSNLFSARLALVGVKYIMFLVIRKVTNANECRILNDGAPAFDSLLVFSRATDS